MRTALAMGTRARPALRAEAAAFLPGRLIIERGNVKDYRELAHLHYVPGDPATWAGVWRFVYDADFRFSLGDWRLKCRPRCIAFHNRQSQIGNWQSRRLVAVGVLSWPTLALRARDRALYLRSRQDAAKVKFLNRNVRTISRVIVHPQFRALGIASALVRRICADCTVRYVEAVAAMGAVHPLFERGGMRRVEGRADEAAYFIFDRKAVRS